VESGREQIFGAGLRVAFKAAGNGPEDISFMADWRSVFLYELTLLMSIN
jgi:hypothetical protein